MSTIKQGTHTLRDTPLNPQTQVRTVARLTPAEYTKLEDLVRAQLSSFRGSDAGALGVVVGAEIVLRIVRGGFASA